MDAHQILWLGRQLVARDVKARYAGSSFGFGWSLATPVLLFFVYGFAFTQVLNVRWPGLATGSDQVGYLLMMFSGLVVHAFFAECISRGSTQIIQNPNYVKKVVFPLPVLAVSQVIGAAFHLAVALFVLVIAVWLVTGGVSPTLFLLPVVCLPLLLVGLALVWLLSSISVYLRDLLQVLGPATTAMLFLSSALYPLDAAPDAMRPLLMLNPLTPSIELLRDVAILGRIPPVDLLVGYTAVSVVMAGFAYWVFSRLQRGFADAL